MQKLLRDESGGIALLMVLGFMALAVPIVTSTLSYTSTLSRDSVVKTNITLGQYGALGGYEHGTHRLLYETGLSDGLVTGVPLTYQLDLSGRQVDVALERITDPIGDPPPIISTFFKDLRTSKVVDTPTAGPGTEVTYIISIQNFDSDPAFVKDVLDGLPAEFSYVPFSTSGITTAEPTITQKQDPDNEGAVADLLRWPLSPPVQINPTETMTLTFRAVTSASIADGNYCNNAWVEPGGKQRTGSGSTAKVVVGTPADTFCPGEAGNITKTVVRADTGGPAFTDPFEQAQFTYTISVENTGTDNLKLNKLWDVIPVDFTYVPGSTFGDFTTSDPSTCGGGGEGCNALKWTFGAQTIAVGQTKSLSFNVQAGAFLDQSIYWNEAWAFFISSPIKSVYTWPTAPIYIFEVFTVDALDPQSRRMATGEIWVGLESIHLALFELGVS